MGFLAIFELICVKSVLISLDIASKARHYAADPGIR